MSRQLRLTGGIDRAAETRISESVRGRGRRPYVYVERGYERPPEVVVVLLVLGALGGVLMLGGTLTATFLALSDARPRPGDAGRGRSGSTHPAAGRGVVRPRVGFVGAVLGAAVGFIPGVAIAQPRPLAAAAISTDTTGEQVGDRSTSRSRGSSSSRSCWRLPLLTAAVVGLTARSRLPLVARLD